MKRTAVLLDLGFVLHKLYVLLGNRIATANEVQDFAEKCVSYPDEELFRIYCYHCWPYGGTETHPLSQADVDFSAKPTYETMNRLLRDIELKDKVAFRAGELSFDGWKVTRWAVQNIANTNRPLRASDLAPDLNQKRVVI